MVILACWGLNWKLYRSVLSKGHKRRIWLPAERSDPRRSDTGLTRTRLAGYRKLL